MIVYNSTKQGFREDVFNQVIVDKINESFVSHLGRRTSENEINSWKNSLMYMNNVLSDDSIPSYCGVSIEYQIPLTSKRIDFILTGADSSGNHSVVIVELKQWQDAQLTDKDGVVVTRFQHGEVETTHPSYQAWSYAATLSDFNSSVQEHNITLHPCAYLHNYDDDGIISHPFYNHYLSLAPAFYRKDAAKLQDFIKRHIKYGDKKELMYLIENGRIRPSKQLADSLVSMLKGSPEFKLLDDQKVAYETAMRLSNRLSAGKKQVLIIEGGPGTGKSVLAINLLVDLTKNGKLAKYISKNSAPREVYTVKLSGSVRKTNINNLFGGSGAFIDLESDYFDVLIVDEAHRLSLKSGMFQNLGENQIKEIISASKMSIFFIDDFQRVTMQDIGSVQEIKKCASLFDSSVVCLKLESQFRCNGSDGYLNWLDNMLERKKTANIKLKGEDFDFKVFDDPVSLREAIIAKNVNNKSRLVAGYCWKWESKKNLSAYDIIFNEHNFKMKWNLNSYGQKWIIEPDSINEVGCIHTCQGLELDYVGVIVGDDLRYENGRVTADFTKHPGSDKAMKGLKSIYKENKERALQIADELIKNTYRVLMSRGMKGCYVYFHNKEMANYVKNLLYNSHTSDIEKQDSLTSNVSSVRVESNVNHDVKYVDYVPFYSLKAACGYFGEGEDVQESGWINVSGYGKLNRNMFVVRACGNSMEPRIKDGDYCLFRSNVVGSRNGKIVLVQHRNFYDSETGGSYSIKKYSSRKTVDEATGEWRNEQIILQPLNETYNPIVIDNSDMDYDNEFMVIGEFIGIVD